MTPEERDRLQASKNVIEVWLRAHDLRGSPPPITWTHLEVLAEAVAELLDTWSRAAVAEEREACAKISEELPIESGEKRRVALTIAAAIRART